MKSKAGKFILKTNTVNMNALNKKLLELSKKFITLEVPQNCAWHENVNKVITEYIENRKLYNELQESINIAVSLEKWSEFE